MTPRTPSDEKMKADKTRLVHFKHAPDRVAPPPARREIYPHGPVNKPPENYENLLLFYLTKLKNLFSSQVSAKSRESSVVNSRLPVHDHNLRSFPRPGSAGFSRPPDENDVQANVYKVVSAAIEYGFANNVLEKKGDCFVLKNQRPRLITRQPTPCPRYCERCCNMHKFVKGNQQDCAPRSAFLGRQEARNPLCEKQLRTIHDRRIDRNRFMKGSPGQKEGLKRPIQHCPECRALEKKKRCQ